MTVAPTPQLRGRHRTRALAAVAIVCGLAACVGQSDDADGESGSTTTAAAVVGEVDASPTSVAVASTVVTVVSPSSGSESTVPSSTVTDVASAPVKEIVTRSPEAVGDGVQPQGFTTVTARVTSADGEVCEVCLWLADAADERSSGLREVTDLGDAVGMAFAWDDPTDVTFNMIGTPTPLSIAWFRPDGSHLSETDMSPCLDLAADDCERYRPGGSYDLAIEMFQGQLEAIGIGPGAVAELVAGTESPTCLVER